jgi:hypothetical protein
MFTNVVSARDGPGPASNYNCLSHIQLDFTVYQYFDFFGVDWMSLGQNVHNADCRNLELLPQLKDLQLRFRYPPEHYDSAQWDGGNGCQQRCIDWLLTFAFPVLAGLKVTFVGGITAGTKKKWEKRLKQKLEGKPESFDFEGELDKIFSIAEQGQVRICSTWCSCSGTSTDDSSQGKGESGTGDDSSPE